MSLIRSNLLDKVNGIQYGFLNRTNSLLIDYYSSGTDLHSIHTLMQIHSDIVVNVCDLSENIEKARGDALISGSKGVNLGVYTADCIPILLADVNGSAIGIVHSGWRGTLSSIVEKTIIKLGENFGVVPENIVSVMGPSISGDCYEVGTDVAELFYREFERNNDFLKKSDSDKSLLDLRLANKYMLMESGVSQVEIIDICTRCNSDFNSYRGDGKTTGSQMSFIGLV